MQATFITALLVASLLAGCSDDVAPPTTEIDTPDLVATADTGVIRGVVVDEAIRPLTGATVQVTGPSEQEIQTGEDGIFGFQGLAPGEYFIRASKPGFEPVQQTTSVVAGVSNPAAVKIQLTVDVNARPYVTAYKFDGFIECSFSFIAAGHATCSSIPDSNDKFIVEYNLDKQPTWTQSEMIWESSQSASEELSLDWSRSLPSQVLLDNWEEDTGASPLLVKANETRAAEVGLGTNITLMIRVFNQHNNGTSPSDPAGDPTDGDDCIERPELGGCFRGVGATIQQPFTIFTHIFYGYTPTEGWRFSENQQVPSPP